MLRRGGTDVSPRSAHTTPSGEAGRVHDPDVVVTDIRMPPRSTDEGVSASIALRTISPRCGVVVLSQHVSAKYAAALLDGGSEGRAYLLKVRTGRPRCVLNAGGKGARTRRGRAIRPTRATKGHERRAQKPAMTCADSF